MSEYNSVSEEIKAHNMEAGKLPFKKRLKHFWYYYKIPFLVLLAVLGFAVYLILHFTLFRPKPLGFAAYALNSAYVKDITSDEERDIDRFLARFAAAEGIDTEIYRIDFNCEYTINPDRADNLDLAYDMNIIAAGQDKEADILMGPGNLIDYYIPNGFYDGGIDNHLPKDFYSYLEKNDYIYYYVDEDGNEYPIGVYIKEAARLPETGLYPDSVNFDPVASIVSRYTPRKEVAIDFLEYLFDYPACAGKEQ